jgi:hypothetical protein
MDAAIVLFGLGVLPSLASAAHLVSGNEFLVHRSRNHLEAFTR